MPGLGGREKWERWTADEHRVSLQGDKIDAQMVMLVAHPCECVKTHRIVCFKRVCFMPGELYINKAVICNICKNMYSLSEDNVVHIYNEILLSRVKERNNATCSNMDVPGEYHTK